MRRSCAKPLGGSQKKPCPIWSLASRCGCNSQGKDRYGRWLGKVLVAEPGCRAAHCPLTVDAGHAQITRGLAWWYRAYAKEQSVVDAATYAHAEKQARAYRLGLWQTKKPTPPWVWRRKH